MPFKSDKQRRWMWANDPEMAQRWEDEEKNEEESKNEGRKPVRITIGQLRQLIKEEIGKPQERIAEGPDDPASWEWDPLSPEEKIEKLLQFAISDSTTKKDLDTHVEEDFDDLATRFDQHAELAQDWYDEHEDEMENLHPDRDLEAAKAIMRSDVDDDLPWEGSGKDTAEEWGDEEPEGAVLVREGVMVSLQPITRLNRGEESLESKWMRIAGIPPINEATLTQPSSSGNDVSDMRREFQEGVKSALGFARRWADDMPWKVEAQAAINDGQPEDQKGNRVLHFKINSVDMQSTNPRPFDVTWTTEWTRLDKQKDGTVKLVNAEEQWESLEDWLEEYLSRNNVKLTKEDVDSYYYTYNIDD
jgi:hypothetical protein